MNYFKEVFEGFKRKEIHSTNNAIEFIVDTGDVVRAIDKYVFLLKWFFTYFSLSAFMDNLPCSEAIWRNQKYKDT